MIKTLILFFALIVSTLAHADAWDNLTLKEAQEVVKELKANPFIFNYCDCCDYEGDYATTIEMIYVKSTEIVTCDWDETFYKVIYEGEIIASVKNGATGAEITALSTAEDAAVSDAIYMNYTWGYNADLNLATPYFSIVPYEYYGQGEGCKANFTFPTPSEIKAVSSNKKYKKWYKKAF